MESKYYITPLGFYYGGEKQNIQDQEVPKKPSDFHEWNGSAWVENITASLNWYKKNKRDELLYFIISQWPRCTKTFDQIKTQYGTFRANVIAATTRAEVDTLFSAAYTWLGISGDN